MFHGADKAVEVLLRGQESANLLKTVLEHQRELSFNRGQCINFDKSSLLFGKRINAATRQEIKDALGIHIDGGIVKYLGIPEDISGSK